MTDLITSSRALLAFPASVAASVDASRLSTLITAASVAISRLCGGREFASTSYDERYDGSSDGYLLLKHFPILSVERLSTATYPALRVTNTDTTTNQRATISTTSTAVVLKRIASAVTTTNTLTFASYTTVGAMDTAINAVGNGWTSVVVENYISSNGRSLWPSTDLYYPQGVLNALNNQVSLLVFDEDSVELEINGKIGELKGSFPVGYQNIRVQYTAGYSTVPEDVQEAAAATVANWYQDPTFSGDMISERLGDYSYTRAAIEKSIPDRARTILAYYRDYAY